MKDPRLAAYTGPDLPIRTAGSSSEWLMDQRPWLPDHADTDVGWTLARLAAACSIFD